MLLLEYKLNITFLYLSHSSPRFNQNHTFFWNIYSDIFMDYRFHSNIDLAAIMKKDSKRRVFFFFLPKRPSYHRTFFITLSFQLKDGVAGNKFHTHYTYIFSPKSLFISEKKCLIPSYYR